MAAKRVISRQHLDVFTNGQTHADVVKFIETLNTATVGISLRQTCNGSSIITTILGILDDIEALADRTPPVDNEKSRFGNPAFRTFYGLVNEHVVTWHRRLGVAADHIPSVSAYLSEAWGNSTRIDYGSGMELHFLCWLLCLKKLELLKPSDYTATVIQVFWKYISVMRKLQSSYWLEPAGSHGAYGLDDYHFLPFVFGSAQLRGHRFIKPKAIHDKDVVDEYAKDYMYLACIKFVNSIKTASLRWHSPMLDDISAVKTWDKVNSGMIKMYRVEVLGKLPVAQHFLFTPLLPFPESAVDAAKIAQDASVHVDDHGHVHVKGEGFGDCCGIPIPSAFAAARAEQAKGLPSIPMSSNVRVIPFD